VNCCSNPRGTVGEAGVIAIDESVAFVTVRLVDPEIEPEVAVIVAVPAVRPLARPAVVMLAMLPATALQVTELVRFCVEPSLKVPVAVNCSVTPIGTEGLAGVTAIEESDAAVTVSIVEPLIPLGDVAVMLDVPVAFVVASPPALIAATAVWEDVHTAVLVRSSDVPSLNIPVALNCCWTPSATDG
jgi:hypothetical protein